MTKPYTVTINGAELTMMLDEEGLKLYPDAKPAGEPASKDDDAEVTHKARRPAKQATPRKK